MHWLGAICFIPHLPRQVTLGLHMVLDLTNIELIKLHSFQQLYFSLNVQYIVLGFLLKQFFQFHPTSPIHDHQIFHPQRQA